MWKDREVELQLKWNSRAAAAAFVLFSRREKDISRAETINVLTVFLFVQSL
jgi:hypothetical protein